MPENKKNIYHTQHNIRFTRIWWGFPIRSAPDKNTESITFLSVPRICTTWYYQLYKNVGLSFPSVAYFY